MSNACGGWFLFEPEILLLNGTSVAREFEEILKPTVHREKGNATEINKLIRDTKILIIEDQKYDTRVEYVKRKEVGNSIFVLAEDGSGTKMWTNILGLACQGADGNERSANKEDLNKGEFIP